MSRILILFMTLIAATQAAAGIYSEPLTHMKFVTDYQTHWRHQNPIEQYYRSVKGDAVASTAWYSFEKLSAKGMVYLIFSTAPMSEAVRIKTAKIVFSYRQLGSIDVTGKLVAGAPQGQTGTIPGEGDRRYISGGLKFLEAEQAAIKESIEKLAVQPDGSVGLEIEDVTGNKVTLVFPGIRELTTQMTREDKGGQSERCRTMLNGKLGKKRIKIDLQF